jgi:multicomponent K+:H+ antiporter subunit E
MSGLFPKPLLSVFVFLTWLALVGTLAPAHVLLAALLALVVPQFTRRFAPEDFGARRPVLALRLVGVVLWDVVIANIAVARLVVGPTARLFPAFVEVELDMDHPFATALLASIVTMTPGTVSVDARPAERRLLVHALHTGDPAAVAADIKTRYEAPLKEIFGC